MRIVYYPFFLCCLLGCCRSDDYQNPVVDSDHPDPGALALPDGSGYVIVSTGVQNGNAYPIMSSVDLVNWQKEGFVFPSGRWPSWALGYMWAPEIHYVNHQYHVYFSAKSSTNQKFCLGVARASSPFGPFEDLGHPLLEDIDVGVIDVHWFRDPVDSVPYLIWKTDDNANGRASKIFIREVAEDGVSFPEGPIVQILEADRQEERNVVEGPWIHYRSPFYYLFYSGNGYANPHYFSGVARSSSVTGPYEKQREGVDVFLHTDLEIFDAGENCTLVGPGHGSMVTIDDNQWFLYHAWRWGQVGAAPGRTLNLDLVKWSDDGWPHIGTPSVQPTPAPKDILM